MRPFGIQPQDIVWNPGERQGRLYLARGKNRTDTAWRLMWLAQGEHAIEID